MDFKSWKKYKLGAICIKIGSGATPKGGKEVYQDSGPYAFIRSQNVLDFSFSYDGLAYINEVQAQKLNNVALAEKDILLNITGDSVARVCQVPDTMLPARVNQHVSIIRPNKKIANHDFLKYLLLNPRFKAFMLVLSSVGGTRNALTKLMIEDFEITLPDLATQTRIAAILTSLDAKIELNRQTNRTLEAMAQTLFEEMCLPKQGEMMAGWREGKLGDVLIVKGGTTPSTKKADYWNGNVHWVTPKDLSALTSPILLDSERKITQEGLKQISSGLLPKGTLLMSSRAPIGYFAITQMPVAINQGFIAINGTQVSNLFMLFWLKEHLSLIMSRANGSTFLEISKSVFKEIELMIPDDNSLMKFDDLVQPLFEKIVNNEAENQTLTALRDCLLPKLMRGEIAF